VRAYDHQFGIDAEELAVVPMSEINHEEARRDAALRQPNSILSGPYLDLTERLESAYRALRSILNIAAEPGEKGAMEALNECQRIAEEALPKDNRVLPFKPLKDVQGE
jgi:hypothetical protein